MCPHPLRRSATRAVLLALVLASGRAQANPLSTHGFGSRETALGSAATADASSFSAVFYNPAGLAHARGLDLSIGYFRVDQRLKISGKDNKVDPVKGVVAGLVAPGKLFGVPFAFGLSTHIPDERISRVRTRRQDIPRWELYDNRGQTLFLAAALASIARAVVLAEELVVVVGRGEDAGHHLDS